MSLRQWLLAGALIVGGCATTGGVSDSDVARLPVAAREQIMTAHKSIEVAQANLDGAKLARDEAKQFHHIAVAELDSSKSRLEAARGSVDLDAQSRDDRALRQASRAENDARAQLVAARAKLDYANRLVELREAKIAEAEANLAAARADVELEKARIAQRNGIARDLNVNKLASQRQDCAERLAEQRAHVADLEGETAQLKTAWDDRRTEVNRTASRGSEIYAPREPEEVPMPTMKWRHDVRGDVNDTPSAPDKSQSEAPRNNIAPPP